LRLFPALRLLLAAYLAFGPSSGRIGSPRHVLGAAAVGLGYVESLSTKRWERDATRMVMIRPGGIRMACMSGKCQR
jgi:hypothetical protein